MSHTTERLISTTPSGYEAVMDAGRASVAVSRRAHDAGILVATDATTDADGAVRVGRALAQRDHVDVKLLSVVEPPPLYDVDGILVTDAEAVARILADVREKQLLVQRDRTFPAASDWPVAIEVGERVEHIVAAGDGRTAGLLVLGLGEHGISARIFARETILRVIRTAKVPVLGVPADAWGVPHSVLAALDFTPSSEHAARAALDLLGGEGTVYLAHVAPISLIPGGASGTWEQPSMDETRDRMHAVERRLDVPRGVKVKHVTLGGDPADELLGFAEEFGVQLIAAGSHGLSTVGRLLMGSVSTQLVRSARSWVLIAPPGGGGEHTPAGA